MLGALAGSSGPQCWFMSLFMCMFRIPEGLLEPRILNIGKVGEGMADDMILREPQHNTWEIGLHRIEAVTGMAHNIEMVTCLLP